MPIMTVKVGKARDVEQKQPFVETDWATGVQLHSQKLKKDIENKN